MIQPAKSLHEVVQEITSGAASIAVDNVRTTAERVGDILRKLPAQQHRAVLAILQTELEVRQQAIELAWQEHQYEQQRRQAEEKQAPKVELVK